MISVGIVIPSFNQAQYLESTIRSCACQLPSVKIYVMDGGSTDGSVEIIRRYESRLSGWRSARDGGQAAAINDGVALLRTDYFTWLNSDDILRDGAVARVLKEIEKTSADVYYGNHATIDGDGVALSTYYHPPLWRAAAINVAPYWAQPGTFIRTAAFYEVGMLDKRLHCVLDTDLWFKFLISGKRFVHINKILASFRLHAGSKGASLKVEYAREYQELFSRYGYYPHGLKAKVWRFPYLAFKMFGYFACV